MKNWFIKTLLRGRSIILIKELKAVIEFMSDERKAKLYALAQLFRRDVLADPILINLPQIDINLARTAYWKLETIRNDMRKQNTHRKKYMKNLGAENESSTNADCLELIPRAIELWMCTISYGFNQDYDNIRSVWILLLNSKTLLSQAISELHDVLVVKSKKHHQRICNNPYDGIEVNKDEWIELCDFVPSFLKLPYERLEEQDSKIKSG